jgi:hypothetical protein
MRRCRVSRPLRRGRRVYIGSWWQVIQRNRLGGGGMLRKERRVVSRGAPEEGPKLRLAFAYSYKHGAGVEPVHPAREQIIIYDLIMVKVGA